VTVRHIGSACWRTIAVVALSAVIIAMGAGTANAKPSVKEYENQIEKQNSDLEGVVEDYNSITEDLKHTKHKIHVLEKKLHPYKVKLDKLYDQAEPIVDAAYETRGMGDTTAILDAGSPDIFVAKISSLDGIVASDSGVIGKLSHAAKKYQDAKDTLDDLKAEQSDKEASLKSKKKKITEAMDRLQDKRKEAFRDDARSRGENIDYVPDYVPGDRGKVVRFALDQRGKPYVWAAAGPGSYDCSGLVLAAMRQVGISLPHSARQQYGMATHISRAELQPGDAVFYNGLQHVALYIGDDYVVHAPNSGETVRIDRLDQAGMSYYGAGRFIN
jgi:cell wall-associated NlpC family hydrolase